MNYFIPDKHYEHGKRIPTPPQQLPPVITPHLQSFANIEESPQVLLEPKTVHIDEHLKGEPS